MGEDDEDGTKKMAMMPDEDEDDADAEVDEAEDSADKVKEAASRVQQPPKRSTSAGAAGRAAVAAIPHTAVVVAPIHYRTCPARWGSTADRRALSFAKHPNPTHFFPRRVSRQRQL